MTLSNSSQHLLETDFRSGTWSDLPCSTGCGRGGTARLTGSASWRGGTRGTLGVHMGWAPDRRRPTRGRLGTPSPHLSVGCQPPPQRRLALGPHSCYEILRESGEQACSGRRTLECLLGCVFYRASEMKRERKRWENIALLWFFKKNTNNRSYLNYSTFWNECIGSSKFWFFYLTFHTFSFRKSHNLVLKAKKRYRIFLLVLEYQKVSKTVESHATVYKSHMLPDEIVKSKFWSPCPFQNALYFRQHLYNLLPYFPIMDKWIDRFLYIRIMHVVSNLITRKGWLQHCLNRRRSSSMEA